MGINIKNAEVEEAVRRLASRKGVDLTEAIRQAVEHELRREPEEVQARLRRMREIEDQLLAMPLLDARTDEEILGYDESGLPA